MNTRQNELKTYDAVAKELRKKGIPESQLPFCMMTLNMGRHHSAAMVKWCKETLVQSWTESSVEGKGGT